MDEILHMCSMNAEKKKQQHDAYSFPPAPPNFNVGVDGLAPHRLNDVRYFIHPEGGSKTRRNEKQIAMRNNIEVGGYGGGNRIVIVFTSIYHLPSSSKCAIFHPPTVLVPRCCMDSFNPLTSYINSYAQCVKKLEQRKTQ